METKKSNRSVYVREITIADYKSFKGEYTFRFVNENDEWFRWTVFLGNNNSGKTNLLKWIAYNVCTNSFPLRPYAYGIIRQIETVGISESKVDPILSNNLRDNSKLINYEDWLFQLDYAAKNGQEKAALQRDLLKQVLVSEVFPEINDIRFVSDERLTNYIQYQTKDGGWYRLSELGYGYQAMLAWLMDFVKKLFDRHPDSPNPLKEPAILLVDEIDLHLHPYWQRTIIKYLSDLFPQTQFIVTTHSPFILQSMENVNLYTLRREGDHTVSVHLGHRSFIGWGIEEILREIMDMGDDIQTDRSQELFRKFDDALNENNYKEAKQIYDELSKILHPESVERKLMKMQLSQIDIPDD
jgi:hypothetical protein